MQVFSTGYQQLFALFNRAAKVIGQTAIGKRNVWTFFKNDNF